MTAILTPIKRKVKDLEPGDLVTVDPYLEDPVQVQGVSNGGSSVFLEFKTGGPLSLDREAVITAYVREELEEKYVSAVDTAKMIRKLLKREYPDIQFYVRTDKYAGGASVNITWKDGPGEDEVRGLVGPFEGKGFDGSIDMSYYKAAWILPDGTATLAHTSGTRCSMGYIPESDTPKPHPDAQLASFGISSVRTSRYFSQKRLERAIREVKDEFGFSWAPEIVEQGFWVGGKRKGDAYSFERDYKHESELREYWAALE